MTYSIPPVIAIYTPADQLGIIAPIIEGVPAHSGWALLLFVAGEREETSSLLSYINQLTPLKVWEATPGLSVLHDQVFVITSASELTLENGLFVPSPKVPGSPEDFFMSVARLSAPAVIAVTPATYAHLAGSTFEEIRRAGGTCILIDAELPAQAGQVPSGNTDNPLSPIDAAGEIKWITAQPAGVNVPGPDPHLELLFAEIQKQSYFIEKVTNATPDIIYILDLRERKVTYVNNRASEVFGLDLAYIYSREHEIFKEVLHPDDYSRRMEHMAACVDLKKNEIKEIDVRLKVADGTWCWFRIRDKAFQRHEDGSVLQTIGIIHDIQERKDALERLKEEHQRLKNAESIGRIGSFVRYFPQDKMYCSDELYRLHGLEPQSEVINVERLLSFVHPDDQNNIREDIWNLHITGKPINLFHRIIRADGVVRYFHRRAEVVTDPSGNPVRAFGTIQDVTELKEAQNDIVESKDLLEAVFNGSLSEMMVLKSVRNNNGEIIDFEYRLLNTVAETLAGRQLAGRRYLEQNPFDKDHSLFDVYRKVVETGKPTDLERYFSGNGFRNWFRIMAVKLDDSLVLTIEDITERKLAEEEIRNATQLLQDVFEGVQVQISYLQPLYDKEGSLKDFKILVSNQEGIAKNKRKAVHTLNQKVSKLLPHFRGHEIWDRLCSVVQTGETQRFETYYGYDGLKLWLDVSLVKSEGGIIYSAMVINDRKQAEEELTKTVTFFKEAETVGNLGSYEVRLDTMKFRFSDQMFRIFGEEPQSFEPTLDFIDSRSHPDDIQVVKRVLDQAAVDKLPYIYTRRIYRSDGEKRTVVSYGNVVEDEHGAFIKFLGTVRDVTEQIKAEQKIKKHLTILQQSEELAGMGSWEYEVAKGQLTWSEGMYRLFYIEQGSPVSLETYYDYVPEEDRPNVEILIDHIRNGQAIPEISFKINTGKKLKKIKVKSTSIFDENSQSVKVLGIDLDISEIEKAEKQLRQSTENLQIVLESSPASVGYFKAVRDQKGQVEDFQLVVCNRKFAGFMQLSKEQLMGLSQRVLTSRLWQDYTFEKMSGVLGSGNSSYEERHSTRNGEEFWYGVSIIKQDDGVVVTGLNITKLRQAELQQSNWMRELERSNESLQSLEEMRHYIRIRGEFLRSTSHDLRGSFGMIVGATSLLDMQNTDEERSQILEILQRNLSKVTHMMNQLLDFSRLESGVEHCKVVPFNATDLMQELCESVKPMAQEKGLWVKMAGPESLWVEGDEVKVRRIAQNLLLNGIKYTEKGGLKVSWGPVEGTSASESGSRWMLTVGDTGNGLAPHLVDLVSNTTKERNVKEYKAKSLEETDDEFSYKAGYSGEGIGLMIVNRLCELLNARLEVESITGVGTVFRIFFPVSYDNK